MARTEKPIDWDRLEKLLMAGVNGSQAAAVFHMTPTTLYHRVKDQYDMNFEDYLSACHCAGIAELLEQQHIKALNARSKGSSQMLMYLGKVRCGQREPEPIREKPPNDGLIESFLAHIKAPESQIDASKQQTNAEYPGSNDSILHMDRCSSIGQDIREHNQADRSAEIRAAWGCDVDRSDSGLDTTEHPN